MENKEIQELKRLCLFVRSSIEICQKQNPTILIDFPHGFCNMASIWLYDYLTSKGYTDITFRMRDPFLKNFDGNHVWLHWKSYDMDITADQFNRLGENFSSCIVSDNDEHYKEYDKEVDYHESYNCDYVPANKYTWQAVERKVVLAKLGLMV